MRHAYMWHARLWHAHLNVRSQVSEFLFGNGFAITEGDNWRVRRKAVQPSLHRAYLDLMIQKVFGPSAVHLASKLEVGALICDSLHECRARGSGGNASIIQEVSGPSAVHLASQLGVHASVCCSSNASLKAQTGRHQDHGSEPPCGASTRLGFAAVLLHASSAPSPSLACARQDGSTHGVAKGRCVYAQAEGVQLQGHAVDCLYV